MMNLEMAKNLLQTGIKKAKEMGKLCSIAIVDDHGWLVALHRMDGAPIPTAEIARDKAWTAATFRISTSEVSRFGDSRMRGYGFNVQNWNERLTAIPGGMPILNEGRLIGAIGVCSETPKEDVIICQNTLKDIFREERDLHPERRKPRKKYGRR
jgi:cob(I)alamin adenosyltransferase